MTPTTRRFFPAPAAVHPPFKTVWQRDRGDAARVPARHLREPPLPARRQRRPDRHGHEDRGHLLDTPPRAPLRLLARGDRQHGLGDGARPQRRNDGRGRIYALNAATGAIRWQRDLSSPSESSPLVAQGRVFFGSQSGLVYALDAATGAVIWTYHAPGAVKASPSLANGLLYFGDYSGHIQAISELTGRRVWISGSGGALLGNGTFYSTAAVIYGRVFLGNTDGRVYAYDAFTGGLDWAVQTGAYVYASPAVTNAPGIGPTVFEGSYDGTFRALNARSGHVSWTFKAHGRISGSATVIGEVGLLFRPRHAHDLRPSDINRPGRLQRLNRRL